MQNKFYNFFTYFYHRILGRPLCMKKALEIKPKKPELTVVFLHGIAANSSTWKHTFSQLSREPALAHTRLVALDLLGFGKSLKADWLDYNYADYDEALGTALNKLHIKTPVIIVGHSMGCLITAHYAKNHRKCLSGLILVSPPILMQDELAKLPDKFYLKSYSSLHKLAEDPAVKTLAAFITKVSSFRDKYLKTTAFARSMENIILNPNNYKTFEKLNVPTHIIHGHFDPLVYGPNLVRVSKNNPSHLKLYKVMGDHDLSLTKRKKILTLIEKALKDETL